MRLAVVANKKALKSLSGGATGLLFSGHYTDITTLLKDIEIEFITLYFDEVATYKNVTHYTKTDIQGGLYWDPLESKETETLLHELLDNAVVNNRSFKI